MPRLEKEVEMAILKNAMAGLTSCRFQFRPWTIGHLLGRDIESVLVNKGFKVAFRTDLPTEDGEGAYQGGSLEYSIEIRWDKPGKQNNK